MRAQDEEEAAASAASFRRHSQRSQLPRSTPEVGGVLEHAAPPGRTLDLRFPSSSSLIPVEQATPEPGAQDSAPHELSHSSCSSQETIVSHRKGSSQETIGTIDSPDAPDALQEAANRVHLALINPISKRIDYSMSAR